ncbi:hypothetical protein Tco_1533229 [Tanacetum coccineum]
MIFSEADMSLGRELSFTAPTSMLSWGEVSLAASARKAERPTVKGGRLRDTDTESMTELASTTSRDTHEIHVRLEDPQNDRALQRGRVNMLFRDRRFHRHISMLLESEARHAQEAWLHSIDCSRAVHAELQAYQAQVNTHKIQIQTRDTRIGSLEALVATLKLKQTEPVEMVMTAMIKELVAEGQSELLAKSDEVEKYVGGLPDMIQGSVMAPKLKKMQDAIEFATKLMDQKIRTLAERQAENKRRFKDTSRNNQNQQQPFKRHNVARAYTAGPRETKPYEGSKPLCTK